jgi:hypothetical protein
LSFGDLAAAVAVAKAVAVAVAFILAARLLASTAISSQ